MAEAGQLAGEFGVLLARGVEQHVQPRQPGRERPRIRAGVVHAVRQQHRSRVAGRHPRQLTRCHLQRPCDVGQPLGRDAQHRIEQCLRRNPLPQPAQHGRVGPERHDGQVVPAQLGRQRADGGGGGADPLAPHRAGHVDQQQHAAPGPDPLPDDDVVLVRERVLDQLRHGAVQVDVVRAAPVPQARQLAGPAPRGGVPARPGHREPGGDLPGPAQRLRVGPLAVRDGGDHGPFGGQGGPAAAGPRSARAAAPVTGQDEPPAPPREASSSRGSASSCLGRRRSGAIRAARAAWPGRRTGESAGTALQPGAAAAGARMNWSSQICRSTASGLASTVSSRKIRPDSATTIASYTSSG